MCLTIKLIFIQASMFCEDSGLGMSFDASGDFSTTEVYRIKNNNLEILKKQIFPHSLGIFYQAITQF